MRSRRAGQVRRGADWDGGRDGMGDTDADRLLRSTGTCEQVRGMGGDGLVVGLFAVVLRVEWEEEL